MKTKAILATLLVAAAASADARFAWPYPRKAVSPDEIGHSMGGMICRLMVTDAGDKIWRDFFATPPADTPLASDTRKLLEEALIFNHRPDIQRVIFISTPHRGSELASNWIGRIGAALVRTPQRFISIYASTKPLLIADPAARPLNRMPNSVDTLEPNDRFVEAVNKLPVTPGFSLSFDHRRPRTGRHTQ